MSDKNDDSDLEKIGTLLSALGLNTARLLERRKTLVNEWALAVASSNVTIRHEPYRWEDEDVQFVTQGANSLRSWEDVEIAFLSDERIEICVGRRYRSTHNYGELGFQDRRNGKPNRAWIMLRGLAKKGGTLPQPSPGHDRQMIQKRMEEIREKLRSHFGIDADPIPFNGNTYQASFAISCRESFDT